MPVLVMITKKHWRKRKTRYILLGIIFIFLFTIIKSQMTTALLISIAGIIFSITGVKNLRKNIIISLFIISFFIIVPKPLIANDFRFISVQIDGEMLQNRLLDIAETIEFGEDIINADTHISYRAKRIPYLLENISKSPIIGGGDSTGHVFWLDRLSLFGLLGIIPWIFVIISFNKIVFKTLGKEYYFYYLISLILFIGIGFIKNSGHKLVVFSVFFINPAMLSIYSQNITIFNSNFKKPNIN